MERFIHRGEVTSRDLCRVAEINGASSEHFSAAYSDLDAPCILGTQADQKRG